jgi:hypothetical protein
MGRIPFDESKFVGSTFRIYARQHLREDHRSEKRNKEIKPEWERKIQARSLGRTRRYQMGSGILEGIPFRWGVDSDAH